MALFTGVLPERHGNLELLAPAPDLHLDGVPDLPPGDLDLEIHERRDFHPVDRLDDVPGLEPRLFGRASRRGAGDLGAVLSRVVDVAVDPQVRLSLAPL